MNLLALDITSTRARALRGPSPREARPVPLERDQTDLPMAISLESRAPVLGIAGRALCRRSPHLACTNFLPYLGRSKKWSGPKQQINAEKALGLIFDHIVAQVGKPSCTVMTIPSWFGDEHLHATYEVAKKSRLELHGSLERPLAAALASHREQPWAGVGLVLDVDEHALTLAAVLITGGEARVLLKQHYAELCERGWKERLLTLIADRCVRQSRRDPRHSADAEQNLYDQLDEVLQAGQEGRQIEVSIRSASWYQNVFLSPEDSTLACQRLTLRGQREVTQLVEQIQHHHPIGAMILTASAARLPGLSTEIESLVRQWNEGLVEPGDSEDFGEQLLDEVAGGVCLHILGPDAPAQVAHELASFFNRGALEPGHLEVAPLLDARPVDRGPARLQFRGRDYLLRGDLCTLGRAKTCDIVFDSEQYPSVSARHCEIIYDREEYVLHDLSRNGTLINDRMVEQAVILQPGDWIRLGPAGPLLRFLGQRQQHKLVSRA